MRKRRFWLLPFYLILLLSSSLILAETTHLKVRATIANVRLKPDLGSRIVGRVAAGTILESEERLGDWFKVSLPPAKEGTKITGYIHISTVEIQAEAPRIVKTAPPREAAPEPKPASPPKPSARLGFRITGGLVYLAGGDANASRTASSANWRDRALLPGSGMTVDGDAQAINWGANFEADIVCYLSPRLGVGLGVGYILARKNGDQSRMVITWPGETRTVARENAFSAIPVHAGVFYDLVQAGRFSLTVNAGLGLYFARWKELEVYDAESQGVPYDGRYETNMHALRMGFHGGLSLEYRLSRRISLVLEGLGRYARFSGFEGDFRQTNSGGLDVTYQGKLYYYEWDENGKTYPWIELLERDPSEINFSSPVKNARLAVVDFSGFSMRAGIKISL